MVQIKKLKTEKKTKTLNENSEQKRVVIESVGGNPTQREHNLKMML